MSLAPCHLCVALPQPHLHGGCPHAEIIVSLAEATVLGHEAWGTPSQASGSLQRGIVRDVERRHIYGFSATGRIPTQAQCPPPQWAVQILSATAQWFEIGDRQHPHRVRSPSKPDIVKAYLNVQEQQLSSSQLARLAEAPGRADRRHDVRSGLCPSAAFLVRSAQASVPWAPAHPNYPAVMPEPQPKSEGRATIIVPARGDYSRALAMWDPTTPTVMILDSTLAILVPMGVLTPLRRVQEWNG